MLLTKRALRWILLALGLIGIITLTGLNLYSLYDIKDRIIGTEKDRQLKKVEEIATNVRREMYNHTMGLSRLELDPIEQTFKQTGQFPEEMNKIIEKAAENRMFSSIYYTPEGLDPCSSNSHIFSFDYSTKRFKKSEFTTQVICDGVGLIKTRAKIQLNDFDYRWNYITEFDTHRSMNHALLNVAENRAIGYLTLIIDRDYLVNELVNPLMKEYFAESEQSGSVLWLYDWVLQEVLATSDESVQYNRDLVSDIQRFPGILSNWNLRIAFLNPPITSAFADTFAKNLIVLGVSVLFLFGALLFMFLTAQQERELAQRQADFLATVTHELKTPLAVMQAAGENISDGRVMEEARLKKYGHHIYSESIRLKNMIEKLLDIAKADAGQNLTKPMPHQLDQLVTDYVELNRAYIEEQGFKLNLHTDANLPYAILDQDSVETIVRNLVENALKYSDSTKQVDISVKHENSNVVLSVSDRGKGIPKSDMKNIFKKFFRVEDPHSAKTKGHGLGLSIVKTLVELNKGTISVKSEIGKGSTFIVSFPAFSESEISIYSEKNGIISQNLTEHTHHA